MQDLSQRLAALSPEKRALLKQQLGKQGSRFNTFPLSFAQQRLWLLDQLNPGNASYNIAAAIRFAGPLRVDLLEKCIHLLVRRHESLRTTFAMLNGEPIQVIRPNLTLQIPLIDLTSLPEAEREASLQHAINNEAHIPFDLKTGPLVRLALLRKSPLEHILLLNTHHIISDGWSLGVFLHELSLCYSAALAGNSPTLPAPSLQYADYAAWQRNWLKGENLTNLLDYWRKQLADMPPLLELPMDHPRPAVQTSHGAVVSLLLPSEISTALKALSQHEGVTLFMTTLALFQILLQRYTGRRDIVIGTPIANRNRTDIEHVFGFFVNTLVLRIDVASELNFRTLLQRVKEMTLEAYAHQDIPFDALLDELNPERSLSHSLLFQVFFNMVNLPDLHDEWPDLKVEHLWPREIGSKFDLTLFVQEEQDAIRLELVYNTDLFKHERMLEMLEQYSCLASQVSERDEMISRYSLVSTRASSVLPDPGAPISAHWEGTIHDLFAQQAHLRPENIAIIDEINTVSYGELEARSNQLAHYLHAQGIRPHDVVAISAQRCAALVLAILGILKAGSTVLILDPSYPPARLLEYVQRAHARGWLRIEGATDCQELDEWCRANSYCNLVLARNFALSGILSQYASSAPAYRVGPNDIACLTFTSGSTGRPKGVLQRHGPLTHFLPWMRDRFAFTQTDRYSLLSGLAHDPLQREIFTPLCVGATICIPDQEHMGDPGWLAQWMQGQEITIASFTPALLQLLTQGMGEDDLPSARIPSLRYAFVVGDALTRRHVARLYAVAPHITCVNLYGSTETQRAVSYFVLPTASSTESPASVTALLDKEVIPLGKGMPGAQILILNEAGNLAGIGELGEIYVRSPHLAFGYLDDPDQTNERFLVNPFTHQEHDRLYRTGDLGRYLPDGNAEFAGRNDLQVKIRGYRIELEEIEAILVEHPMVADAAVIIREDTPDNKQIVAYITHHNEQVKPVLSNLRAFVTQRLPAFMVPAHFVFMSRLPLNANGKVDRKALPAPEAADEATLSLATPQSPIQEELCLLWCELLGLKKVGITQNFFELGGHSLLATQLLARINEKFNSTLSLRSLFEAPTIEGIASLITVSSSSKQELKEPVLQAQAKRESEPKGPQRIFLDERHGSKMEQEESYLFAASFAQERLWFLHRFEPESSAYHLFLAFELDGQFQPAAFEESLNDLLARHESLRTSFVLQGEQLMQRIHAQLWLSLSQQHLSLPAESESSLSQQALQAWLQQEIRRPFDLQQAPLLRASLLHRGSEPSILLLCLHHIIADGWSLGILLQELSLCYNAHVKGISPQLAPLPLQYADYAVWQRAWLQEERQEKLQRYWHGQLATAPALLDLPTDHPRPPIQTFVGARHQLHLPAELLEQLMVLSHQQQVTLYMTLLAAFLLLLYRYSGQEDLVVGTPIAGRQRRELEGVIGLFANTLVLRTDLSGDPSFLELLQRVREVTLQAYSQQDMPFEKLVAELQPERSLAYNPLFQVFFALQNVPGDPISLEGLDVTQIRLDSNSAKFDLSWTWYQEDEKSLSAVIEYNTALFEPQRIAGMATNMLVVLQSLCQEPRTPVSLLPLLSAAQRLHLLSLGHSSSPLPAAPSCGLHHLIEAQCERSSLQPALHAGSTTLTYRQLNQQANQLAHLLRQHGIGPGCLVGLCLHRSPSLLLCLLAILKTGAAYVPLDPDYPSQRLLWMAQDAQLSLLLTHEELKARWPHCPCPLLCLDTLQERYASLPCEDLQEACSPAQLAYVIYTSGSTGRPKGVQISHGALLSFLLSLQSLLSLSPHDRWLAITSISFDIAGLELYLPLLAGAQIQLASQEQASDPRQLASLLAQLPISILQATPTTWQLLLETGWSGKAGLTLLSGGETLPLDLARRLLPCGQALWNLYGPTETTIWSTAQRIEPASLKQHVPIGRPLANTTVYVLDAQLHPQPLGIPGELYIGGEALAHGYLAQPCLSAQRFLPDPFSSQPGARLYRSGDLASWQADGSLRYHQRGDSQVKLHGHRIELGEIEHLLLQQDAILQALVLLREEQLVAYVRSSEPIEPVQLRSQLSQQLPAYMLPHFFVQLEQFPLTPNGKLDRLALPPPDRAALQAQYIAPRTPTEEKIATIWTQLLGIDHISIQSNFFRLGGHSLLATQLAARINEAFQIDVSLRAFFEAPTIESQAVLVEQNAASSQVPQGPILRPLDRRPSRDRS